jgi:hypothetical protein
LHYIYFDYEIDKDGQYSIISTKKTSFWAGGELWINKE